MERAGCSLDNILNGSTRLSVCVLLLVCLLEPALAELRIDVPYGNAQGWKIGYSNSLKGCLAQAVYNGDTTIWWGFTEDKSGDKSAYIALANTKWKFIEKNKTYELVLRMRGHGNWRGKFFGIETNGGMGLAKDGLAKKFVVAFAEAGGVEFYVGRNPLVSLNLSGSRSAVGSVLDCERDAERIVAEGSKSQKESNETSSGTGIIVSDTGHIITNNHVVEKCGQIEVSRVGQTPVLARKSASDARIDLALLKSDATNVRVPSFRTSARLGEEVFAFGFPLAGLLSKSGNFTSGAITALSGIDDDTARFQISAPVQPGNSGGPLLDKYGNIAGVVVSKLNSTSVASVTGDIPQNVNFAIKSSIAVSFLESNGIKVSTGLTGKALESADVAELATQYAVYIVCKSGSAPAAQPKNLDRVGQPSASDNVAPVAQRVVLYDEDPSNPRGKQYVGSVIWRTEPVKASGNQKADVAVRADVDIPDRKYKMTMSFRRNTDSSLPASHTAELTFILPQDFSGGGIGNVPGILMKSNEQARGTPLSALATKVTDGFFVVGLSNVDSERMHNLQLLKERSWFDVPLVYTNQRRAIIAIEKGAPGERAFNEAFAAWGE